LASDYIGNIFFSEPKTGVVRQIDPKGNMTVLVGPSGSVPYSLIQPAGLATDGLGNIYIVEAGRVSMYIPPSYATGTPASVQLLIGDVKQAGMGTGDGGPAMASGINPRSIAVDIAGNIYVADSSSTLDFHNRVRIVTGGSIAAFAGGSLPSSSQLYFPRAVALGQSGTIYIADTANNRIRSVTSDGKISTLAGTGTAGTSGDQGSATSANLNAPVGIALDSSGNVYVSDGALIRKINGAGVISTVAGGSSSTQISQAGSLAIDGQNNIYVDQLGQVSEISAASQSVSTAAGTGTPGYAGDNGPAASAQIADVAGVAVDASGNLYIADKNNGRIRMVDTTGNISTIAGGGNSSADGIAATSAALNLPLGVAVDAAGNIYIAEYGGNRIRVVNASGTIQTIAGNGLQGFSGDGELATLASLNGPTDVKVDGQGNVYVADSLNSSIRRLAPITASPTPAITRITNAGSLSDGPVAPGERVILTGMALGPAGKVTFDNTAAPVLSSSLTSTLVVVPYEVAGQTSSKVTVTTGGISSTPFVVQIAASAPGIYTVTADGLGPAVAFTNNGSLNSPNNPSVAGDAVTILCTGAGVLSPAVATGAPVPASTPSPLLPVTATLNGVAVGVDQAYSLPGTMGQFAVDVRIPDDAQSNSGATVQITVGSAASQFASISVVGQSDNSDGGGDSGSDAMMRRRPGLPQIARPLPPTR
jgi:uncharacterized protein (TIGR03437 family)